MKIFKYVIPEISVVEVQVYEPFKVLSIGMQNGKIVLWATADDTRAKIARRFYVLDTGQEMPEAVGCYYGTVTDSNGYVSHVFEKTS